MLLDKTLLLKGVAGVAAVGGVVGGGYVFREELGIVSSSKKAKGGEVDAVKGNLTSSEDSQGIPSRCSSSPCDLTEEELKKIKFETLGDDETTAVTVEGFPTGDQKLTLTIDSTDTTKKKYIFSNGSSNPVKIKRGTDESKTVTLNSGKTKFSLSSDKLKQFTLNDYGLPSDCTSGCSLTSTDLEDIKFEGLGTDAGTVTVTPNQKVTLTIDSTTKKYKFNNTSGSEITIKKGDGETAKTVTLVGGRETEFKENSGSLKYVEPTETNGVPSRCTTSPTNCELSEENLKNIKFETLEAEGVTGDISLENFPGSSEGKLTLTIDSTDASNKRYIFNNPSSSNEVKIKRGSKTVTLKSGKTRFTVASDKLKERTFNTYGIPDDCKSTCTLTADDLGEIKFEELNSASGTVTVTPSDKTVTLTIESSPKKYKFKNTDTSAITITKGTGGTVKTVTLNNGITEYKENSGTLKFVEPTEANGVLSKCTKTETTPCTLSEENLKNIKFQAYGNESGEVTVSPSSNQITLKVTTSNSKKIYTFNNSSTSAVTLKKGSGSNSSVTLEVGDTEFTDDSGKLKAYEDSSFTAVNSKIGNLKLPNKCKFKSADSGKTTKECDVTKDELKIVGFSNKQDGHDLTIELSPTSSETIKLEIKKLKNSDDKDQYGSYVKDNDPLVVFKNETSKITIKGKDNTNIIIPKGTNMEFLMKESSSSANKLSKYQGGLTGLPNSWGVTCTKVTTQGSNKYNCNPSGGDTPIRFFTDSTNFKEIKVSNVDETKNIFTAEEDTDDYNQGFKFTVKDVISTNGSSITLTPNDTYEIKYISKKWGFVKKNGGR